MVERLRALALQEVRPRDILRVLVKELRVSVLLAALLAVVAFARVLAFGGGSTMPEGFSLMKIGLAVSIALGLQVVSATLIVMLSMPGLLFASIFSSEPRDPRKNWKSCGLSLTSELCVT